VDITRSDGPSLSADNGGNLFYIQFNVILRASITYTIRYRNAASVAWKGGLPVAFQVRPRPPRLVLAGRAWARGPFPSFRQHALFGHVAGYGCLGERPPRFSGGGAASCTCAGVHLKAEPWNAASAVHPPSRCRGVGAGGRSQFTMN
jgi:hypothetical protein